MTDLTVSWAGVEEDIHQGVVNKVAQLLGAGQCDCLQAPDTETHVVSVTIKV